MVTAPRDRAARLMSVGHGGQVLVSLATNELGAGWDRVRYLFASPAALGEPERIFQVVHPGLESEFAALRSLDVHN
jgi:class 3 adenylate cyclase